MMDNNLHTNLLYKFSCEHSLSLDEYKCLLSDYSQEHIRLAAKLASDIRDEVYGKNVFVRGLIEFTNHCKNNCFYCGIRCGNLNVQRYRLSEKDILACCKTGYDCGYRTFVLQGGEDAYFSPEKIEELVTQIKSAFPDCALTLSFGEHSKETYARWFSAGADRYLLRHETANPEHYKALHPDSMSYENRMECLQNLKEIGYQVGCGFMVGSPFQTVEHLAKDLLFLQEFKPHMVGIGPFIPHKDTPFASYAAGTLDLTLFLLSLIRMILPQVLLPATTALGTIHPEGREKGILAGANVCMPNLSPDDVREKYSLYDNKLSSKEESVEGFNALKNKMEKIGYQIVVNRGDYVNWRKIYV